MDFLLTKLEFEDEVQKIEQIAQKRIVMCTQVIGFCQKILENYRRGIRLEIFGDISSEIQFFKEHKQHPQSHLIFYHKLLRYELALPNQDEGSRRNYLLRKIKKINEFILSQIDFIQYLELEQVYMDEFYFTRKFNDKKFHSNRIYDRDPEFSTSHDLLLSELKAEKLFLLFLQSKLLELDHPNEKVLEECSGIQWTSSKVALTELIYALYHNGAINNGKISLKELVEKLEKILEIELGDYHHTFLRLRARSEPVKFIDTLRNDLFERMHKMDD
ncbi:MAG: RteC domain-containing protein [Bacteroidota bacterium]